VYSDAEAESLAVRMADEAFRLGPPLASKSYLDTNAILKVAVDSGAGAVHPDYGSCPRMPSLPNESKRSP
jgi:acetyl-CoA carboxylase biotin carboxylase subunit